LKSKEDKVTPSSLPKASRDPSLCAAWLDVEVNRECVFKAGCAFPCDSGEKYSHCVSEN